MKKYFLLIACFFVVAPVYASQSLIEKMAKEFRNMPESALENAAWKGRIQSVDIEAVPAAVVNGLVAEKVMPSDNEQVNIRLVGDIGKLRNFRYVVRESFLLQYADGRAAGYAFAIDECTPEECYGFYGLYFFPNGSIAYKAL